MKRYLVILLFGLSGCVQLLPDAGEPAKKVFLTPQIASQQSKVVSPNILIVERPQAQTNLASNRLKIIYESNHLPVADAIAGFEWEEKLPDMLQKYMISALENAHLSKGIVRGGDNVKGDFILKPEIRHFEVFNIGKPYVKVEVAYKVISTRDQRLMAQRVFKHEYSLDCLSLANILHGYSNVVETLLQDLTTWLLQLN